MSSSFPIPTVDEVIRISRIEDPVVRNLQITQCYHELSAVLAECTGMAANWCTFAAWASKQAGQSIRKEDLTRLIQNRLQSTPSTEKAVEALAAAASREGQNRFKNPRQLALRATNFSAAIERTSAAISRGNQKVFEEIGLEFARFYETCLFERTSGNDNITRFCEELRPGEPPEGQGYLRQAFTHYHDALCEPDLKTRAELIFLANVQIGFHEQTRLQPEIAESLDAGFVSFLQFSRPLFASMFPMSGLLALTNLYIRRLLGRPTALDQAAQALLSIVKAQLRQVITELMMTIALPTGVRLRLSKDLSDSFPDSLKLITNLDLRDLLEKYDPTPDSPINSGVFDWADLPDRLHFIIDLFRCHQENQQLFLAPFTPEQTTALKAGKLPAGAL